MVQLCNILSFCSERSLAEGLFGLTMLLFQCGCLFFFSQQAGVAEELDLELALACISHRISSFRVKVLRRKQMLAQLRQSHSQSCMLSKQTLQPKCLPAAQKVWGSDRSSLLSSWARRSMGNTIHLSCTAGKGLAEEGFLAEAFVEDQLCLASLFQPLFCPAHCAVYSR